MLYFRPAALLAFSVLLSLGSLQPLSAAQASGTGGTLQGTINDPSGATVAAAEVTLSSAITGYSKNTRTDAGGNYRFVNVPYHHYQLSVTVPGFQSFTQDVDVHTSVPIQLNAQLALSAATETVNVSASSDLVENVPTPHTDVSESVLTSLPVSGNGQGLSDAITLSSGGVVADSNGFFHPQGDHGETTYVVDGQPISDQQNKVFSTQLPPNAFQSLELVSSSPNAEFGDKTSLIVNATTRTGLGQAPTGSLDLNYGSFGTLGEDMTFALGGSTWGNFVVLDSSRSGRFADSPEFWPNHDIGNTENIFDRADLQPGPHDSLHLDLSFARNWFQIPNTYDQPQQDQRQQAQTYSAALGYQHTFSTTTLLSVNPFFRQDHEQYYPSRDVFNDNPATIDQNRHLTNWGTRIDLAYSSGIHNVKFGTQLMQTRLNENFGFGITNPLLNAVCADASGPVIAPGITAPQQCAGPGFLGNPGLSSSLLPFDLTRGGALFRFSGSQNVNQQAVYAQDQITVKNLTLSPGIRFDHYDGITADKLAEPRIGVSYLLKRTNTVLRGSYDRTMETPYNENLILSSTTGGGGLAGNVFGGYGVSPLRPGHRNEFSTGFEQALGKYVQLSADYFWKYTQNAFDFDTLFNTPITFPIEWRQSRIDGVSARVSTRKVKGFSAYMTLGHTRARFFGPENGGLIFNSPLSTGVFRIDHDQEFQQTSYLRYQHGKDGVWAVWTWRYDGGEVAGAVTNLNDALALDGDQQAVIGLHCGSQFATIQSPIANCGSFPFGATRLNIPSPGTFNPDHNPPRIAPRNVFDASVGTDNLFHKERLKTTLKLTAINITNEASLYNFLSTFSGTHWISPRSYQVTLGWAY